MEEACEGDVGCGRSTGLMGGAVGATPSLFLSSRGFLASGSLLPACSSSMDTGRGVASRFSSVR